MKIEKINNFDFNLILGTLAANKSNELKEFIKWCFSLSDKEKKEIIDCLYKEGNYGLYKKIKEQKEQIK